MLEEGLDLRLDNDNSVFARVIKVLEFVFTDGDYAVLSEYKRQHTSYIDLSQMYLNYVYLRAERAASNYVILDMKARIASMVKKFAPDTINQYGAKLAPMLFLLFNAWRLSPFEGYPFLGSHGIDLLFSEPERCDTGAAKMQELGNCFGSGIRSETTGNI